jgi:hypothetical protein
VRPGKVGEEGREEKRRKGSTSGVGCAAPLPPSPNQWQRRRPTSAAGEVLREQKGAPLSRLWRWREGLSDHKYNIYLKVVRT